MKKLIIVFALIMVLFYSYNSQHSFTLANYFEGNINYYCKQQSPSSLNLGFCYLSQEKPNQKIIGESITISNLEVSTAIKTLKAKIIKTETLPNTTTVIYAYSPLIKSNIEINNKKTNLQIAIKDHITTIGWPLILGSF